MCDCLYFAYIYSLLLYCIMLYIVRDIDIRSKHEVKTI